MSNSPLLSICMIVKDEEKNLPRCLDSLSPVLNEVEGELIIVDTGSTDETISIAEKYTSKVFMHKWNNNFSDMRNISISYASGQWIFIIDADEELDNPEELIALLKSKQINKYNTVRFKEKNFTSLKHNRHVFNVTERLFINDGSFKYTGSVHNQPDYKQPVWDSDVLLNHYGYDNEDMALIDKKFKRTSEILKKELASNPDHVYYRYQLARMHLFHKDTDNALKEIRKTYSTLKSKFPEQMSNFYYIMGDYAMITMAAGHHEETVKICKEGIELKEEYIDLYYYMGYASFYLDKKEQGIKALEKYFELFEKGNQILTKHKEVEIRSLTKRDRSITAYKVAAHLYGINNFESALKYIKLVDDNIRKIEYYIKIQIKLGNYKDLNGYYRDIKDDNESAYFVLIAEQERNSLQDVDKMYLAKELSKGSDSYAQLNKIRTYPDNIDLIKSFIALQDLNKLSIVPYSEVFLLMFRNKMSLVPVLKGLINKILKKYVKHLNDENEEMRDYFLSYLINEKVLKSDYHANRIYICIAQVVLLTILENAKNVNEDIADIYHKIFDLYIERGINYVSQLYQIDRIRLIFGTLDNFEDKFFILMYLAQNAVEMKNIKSAIKYYKEATDAYPYIGALLNKKVKDLQTLNLEYVNDNLKLKNEEIKVIHGTMEIANQMNTISEELKNIGIISKTINYYPSYLNYKSDYVFNFEDKKNSKNYDRIISEIVNENNIFHLHFGTSLMPDNSDLPILKKMGKKVFMHHWGSDVRMYSIAKNFNKYIKVKTSDEESLKIKLDFLSQYIDDCIVADYELYEYVKDYYKNIHFLPQAIDLTNYSIENDENDSELLIVHAPTSPEIKGTVYVLEAIEYLKSKYKFNFILVQNMSHEDAKKVYNQADIIIDQILLGTYGLFAIETMAMGKPVITWISDYMKDKYPKELPIIPANPDCLSEKIEILIKDAEMRKEIGIKSRAYVENYHDVKKVCSKLVQLYQNKLLIQNNV